MCINRFLKPFERTEGAHCWCDWQASKFFKLVFFVVFWQRLIYQLEFQSRDNILNESFNLFKQNWSESIFFNTTLRFYFQWEVWRPRKVFYDPPWSKARNLVNLLRGITHRKKLTSGSNLSELFLHSFIRYPEWRWQHVIKTFKMNGDLVC